MAYSKPYLTIAQQLALIQQRGMIISDPQRAALVLQKIGYYRLSGYWYPFRDTKLQNGITVVGNTFRPDTELSTIIDLYIFDKKLRLLFLDAFERIEIALRVQISLTLGLRGPLAHRDPALLHGNFSRRTDPKTGRVEHQEWLRRTDEKFKDSREDFAKHFRAKYVGDHPPIWIACETWDFGAMSYLFNGLANIDQKAIAAEYGLTFDVLTSWIRAINVARNVCAHHSRLWNRPNPSQPKWPSAAAMPNLTHIAQDTKALTRTYGTAALTKCLLNHTSPDTEWSNRLKALCNTFPAATNISLSGAGFPPGWEMQPLWN
jgi:abortive infection bacteriophage resistance protein